MAKIPPQSDNIQDRKIGVEAAHGFGDGLFNAPLIKALSEHHKCNIGVAVRPHCKDAFHNLPWVSETVEIPEMHHGIPKLKKLGYKHVYQITQNVKFFEFKGQDPNHSLVDTPLCTGRQLKIPAFDQRPIFNPTTSEITRTANLQSGKPAIAIETVFKSAQSWANNQAFTAIINKYLPTHRILWLSNSGAPKKQGIDDLLRFSRREVIMCLRACDIFFSVGSGFFCASLALPKAYQPKKIVCLWTDSLYRYEASLQKHQWHTDITWIHNQAELNQHLKSDPLFL